MHIIEKTLRAIVIAAIFALPPIAIIVANSLFFPFITGKNFTFRVLVEVMTAAWLALALVYPRYRPRRSWILGSFTLFVIIIAIADAQGVMPFKSFWSNYERMDGWITLAHTFAYLVVASCVITTENLWRKLLQWSLIVSMFLSLWGLAQVMGEATIGQGGAGGLGARVDATFGNPIYMAAYMLFNIFFSVLLWYQMWVVRGRKNALGPSIFYGAAIFLDTVALLFSGTRGTMLGLLGGGFLALVLFAFSSSGTKRLKQTAVGLFMAGVVLGALLLVARQTPVVQDVVFLNRLSTISLSDNTTKARLLNMEMAWQGVKERPILGWGQENYAIVFDKYYDGRMYAQEQWFDRVHNIIFDWWIAGGTLGLLAYLSIFAAILWTLWRTHSFTIAERAIITGLMAGYFIHNFFVFDNVTSYILFATILAYILYRENHAKERPLIFSTRLAPEGSLPLIAAAAALALWGSAWFLNAHALAANQALIAAISPQGDPSKNLAFFDKAISYGTFGTQEAREQLAQTAMQIAGTSQVSASLKQQFADDAVKQLQLQEAASPLDARFPLFIGGVLDTYGDYKDAKVALEKAHELSPNKQTILYQLAQNAQVQGDTAGAIAYFKEAYEVDTDNHDALFFYAASLISASEYAQADQLLAPLIPTGEAADTRIAAAYASRNRYDKLIPIWEAHVKAQPSDMQAYFTLAAIYYSAGQRQSAITTLQTAEGLDPSLKAQAEQYISEINSGTVPQ